MRFFDCFAQKWVDKVYVYKIRQQEPAKPGFSKNESGGLVYTPDMAALGPRDGRMQVKLNTQLLTGGREEPIFAVGNRVHLKSDNQHLTEGIVTSLTGRDVYVRWAISSLLESLPYYTSSLKRSVRPYLVGDIVHWTGYVGSDSHAIQFDYRGEIVEHLNEKYLVKWDFKGAPSRMLMYMTNLIHVHG